MAQEVTPQTQLVKLQCTNDVILTYGFNVLNQTIPEIGLLCLASPHAPVPIPCPSRTFSLFFACMALPADSLRKLKLEPEKLMELYSLASHLSVDAPKLHLLDKALMRKQKQKTKGNRLRRRSNMKRRK
eukprot:222238_1